VKLIVITQRVDPDDPALGATVPKLRALAERVDELVVLALDAVPTAFPPNVRVKLFGAPTQLQRGLRFVAALAPELRRRPVAVLAHMAPIYAVLAAPLVRARGAPLLLWFTHWRRSPTLRLAERLSTRVLSVDARSFPINSRKLVAVGHGIEIGDLPLVSPHDGTLRLLALGRTSPAKGLVALVEAVAALPGVTLEICGPSLTAEESRHRDDLLRLIEELELSGRVRVEAAVPRSRIHEVYGRCDVLANNMRAGALDKVVYEAAAAALPVLVASEGFDGLVGGIEPPLRFLQDDVASIVERVLAVAALSPDERHVIGLELRRRVDSDHSVGHWADRVVEAARP
jgi:glycosyltransferase involved in cell wall biosynthesis